VGAKGEEETYSFYGFKRERGVTVENPNRPRTLIVVTTTVSGKRGAHCRGKSDPTVEGGNGSEQNETPEEENETRRK